MNTKNILSYIALLGGETIIIAAFIVFRGELQFNILILNIVVSSIVYGLFFIEAIVPWVDFRNKSQNKIGSIGVRWFFTLIYTTAAVAVIFLGNSIFEWKFNLQIIIQCSLVFLLLLGFIAAIHSSEKVQEVYQQEILHRNGIKEMQSSMLNLKNRMNELPTLPENFIYRINAIDDGLRFISPVNNKETTDLELSFIKIISDISFAISNFSMNEDSIETNLKKLERIYQNRKSIYSN